MLRWEKIVRSSPFDTSGFQEGTHFIRLPGSSRAHLISKKSATPTLFKCLCSSPKSTRKRGPRKLGKTSFKNKDLPEPEGPERQTGRSSAKMSPKLAGR